MSSAHSVRTRFLTLATVIALLVTTAIAANPADAARDGGGGDAGLHVDTWLTLLHNNDGESALLTREVEGQPFGGVANFATLVDALRDEGRTQVPNPGNGRVGATETALLVSSGDNFLAGAQFQASLDKGVPYYDAIAMDLMNYDAVAIGNHDFDFGPDVLENFINSYTDRTPYLSANLDFSLEPGLQALEDRGRIAGSVVVRQRGETFGIIGATTEMLSSISSPRDVIVGDVQTAVQAEVDFLEARGVDKIILISHLQSIAEDQALATGLSGVDIMVAGGGDELLANPDDLLIPGDENVVFDSYPILATDADGKSVPVVTTSGGYSYVGRLKVAFDSNGEVMAVDESSGPVRVTSGDFPDAVEPDPDIQALVVDPVTDYVAALATTVVAQTEAPLNSARGVVDDNVPPTIVQVPGERVSETNLGNLAADALLWQATELAPVFGTPVPDVAFQNGGGIRQPDEVLYPNATPAAPADVTRLDVNNQFPFPNFVVVIPDVPLSQIKVVLENAVSRVEFVDGRFAQIAGLTFHWDSTGTPNVDRVTDISIGGAPVLTGGAWVVDETTTVNVATIDFLANGGDEYDFGGAVFEALGVTYEQGVLNYLAGPLGGVISAADYANIIETRSFQDG